MNIIECRLQMRGRNWVPAKWLFKQLLRKQIPIGHRRLVLIGSGISSINYYQSEVGLFLAVDGNDSRRTGRWKTVVTDPVTLLTLITPANLGGDSMKLCGWPARPRHQRTDRPSTTAWTVTNPLAAQIRISFRSAEHTDIVLLFKIWFYVCLSFYFSRFF